MKSAENNAENTEDDHTGVSVAVCWWGVERRNTCGTTADGAAGDDSKNGSEDERDEGYRSEEREEENDNQKQHKE